MPLANTLPAPLVQTILTRLAVHFLVGSGDDMPTARLAAAEMVGAYDPQNQTELALAASIVSFTFQALEALSQAASPDIPITRVLRLRGSAVSLSRESEKAQRRLTQLQKTQPQALPAPVQQEPIQQEPTQPEPAQPQPITTETAAPIRIRSEQDRQQAIRIAASIKRAEAMVAASTNPATLNATPSNQSAPQAAQTAL